MGLGVCQEGNYTRGCAIERISSVQKSVGYSNRQATAHPGVADISTGACPSRTRFGSGSFHSCRCAGVEPLFHCHGSGRFCPAYGISLRIVVLQTDCLGAGHRICPSHNGGRGTLVLFPSRHRAGTSRPCTAMVASCGVSRLCFLYLVRSSKQDGKKDLFVNCGGGV